MESFQCPEASEGMLDEITNIYVTNGNVSNWLAKHDPKTPRGNTIHGLVRMASSAGGLVPERYIATLRASTDMFGNMPESRFLNMLKENDLYARQNYLGIMQELVDSGILKHVELCHWCYMCRLMPEHDRMFNISKNCKGCQK